MFLVLAPFFAAIAIAYFAKVKGYSLNDPWMWAAGVAFIAAFTCFFGAIKGWPFPPWIKISFPTISLNVYGVGTVLTERELLGGMTITTELMSFRTRLVNLEPEQNASLTVRLYVKLRPGSAGRVGETIYIPPDWELPSSLNLDQLRMPISLPPGTAVGGDLVYEINRVFREMVADPFDGWLVIEDHISAKWMKVRAQMGQFGRGDMQPAIAGVEILGPEYEDAEVRDEGGERAEDLAARSAEADEDINNRPSSSGTRD